MDTTKDIDDVPQNDEANNVDGAIDEQPYINTTNTPSNISSGLQQIDDGDNDDLPLPMGMAEEISNRAEPPKQIGKVEQIDDDDSPEPPAAMLEESLHATDPDINNKISETISNNLASVNDNHSPPTPFNS